MLRPNVIFVSNMLMIYYINETSFDIIYNVLRLLHIISIIFNWDFKIFIYIGEYETESSSH